MNKKKHPEIEIQELIIVKCGLDWCKTYYGIITREMDGNVETLVRGSAIIDKGKIWSMAWNEDILGNNLDELCYLHIEAELHSFKAEISTIKGIDICLN